MHAQDYRYMLNVWVICPENGALFGLVSYHLCELRLCICMKLLSFTRKVPPAEAVALAAKTWLGRNSLGAGGDIILVILTKNKNNIINNNNNNNDNNDNNNNNNIISNNNNNDSNNNNNNNNDNNNNKKMGQHTQVLVQGIRFPEKLLFIVYIYIYIFISINE